MPLIKSKTTLESLVAKARAAKLMSFDTETTGLNWATDKCIGASFSFDGEEGYYIGADLLPVLALALGDPEVVKVAHNAKFDLHFLREAGVVVRGKVYDTEVLCRIDNENRLNFKLKDLCAEYFGDEAKNEQDDLKKYMAENGLESYAGVPLEILAPYACKDAVLCYRLYLRQVRRLEEKDKGFDSQGKVMTLASLADREADVTRVACSMEKTGHLIDLGFLESYSKTLTETAEKLTKELCAMVGNDEFNPNSDEQVADAMLKFGWLPKERTPAGKPKVDKYALDDWDHPFAEKMREHRRCTKLVSTYCKGMTERAVPVKPGVGLIHPDYRTNGAVTGRFSCTNPNLQNIDKKSEARKAFIVREGYTNFYLDYKQIEICGFVYYANDMLMRDALWQGTDFHLMNATAIFDKPAEAVTPDERNKAKTFNFALLYGAGEAKIAKMLGVSREEAGMFKKRYMAKFPSVTRLRYKCEDFIRRRGWVVNRFGRRRNLPAEDCYKAMNALIQSWAADLLKEALVRVHTALAADDADVLLQIHDEVVIQIKDGPGQMAVLKKAVAAMESVGELVSTVPIRVDVKMSKTNWFERAEVKL